MKNWMKLGWIIIKKVELKNITILYKMSDGVGLNVNVAYQPNNRVMNVRRSQTVNHPPSNGSKFTEQSDFIQFRVMNTPNTFIDPTKTRLNFSYQVTDISGPGNGRTLQDQYGVNVAVAGQYQPTLSNAGIAGFFNRIEVRVGGSTVEDIRGSHQISKFFQGLQVPQSTQVGLLSLTEGFNSDGAGVEGQGNPSAWQPPAGLTSVPTRNTNEYGTNTPAYGRYLSTASSSSANGTNWATDALCPKLDGSLPILSNLLGAGAGKFFPLCMLRSALEIFIHIEPDVRRSINAIGAIETSSTVSNVQNSVYTTCSYTLSDINLQLGLLTFNEDTMDLIRTQIPPDMKLQWTGEQMTCVGISQDLAITDQEFIVPGCNYRNLKAIYMLQQDTDARGSVDWFNYNGYALCNQQYSIDGRQFPKSVIGQNEIPVLSGDNQSRLNSGRASFARHLTSAVNQTSMNLRSGLYLGEYGLRANGDPVLSASHQTRQFWVAIGYNPIAGLCIGDGVTSGSYPGPSTHKNHALSKQWCRWGFSPETGKTFTVPGRSQAQFATGYSFTDIMEYGNNIRVGQGVDTSRSVISTRVRRSPLATTMDKGLYTFIPYFGVEYVLDLNSGVLTRDV
jgi:hypothetical protein